MTDQNSVLDQLMRIRYDLTAAQGKLTDAMETIAALNLSGARRPRAGSPRELHPDACPHCELAAGHTQDCPTVAGLIKTALDEAVREHDDWKNSL